jgi:hypothetical protein
VKACTQLSTVTPLWDTAQPPQFIRVCAPSLGVVLAPHAASTTTGAA